MPWTRKRASSPSPASFAASSSNTRMNSAPIALRLASGSVTPLQLLQEARLGVDRHQRHLEGVAEGLDDLLALVLAHQPVIDEHARQLIADRAVHEQRGDRGVDAAGEPADHLAAAHLLADPPHLFLDDRGRRPVRLAAADLGQEAGRGSPARRGCGRPRGGTGFRRSRRSVLLHRGHRRAGRGGQRREARRRLVDGVAVRHPAGLLARQPLQQHSGLGDLQLRAPELAHLGLLYAAAERVDQQLHAVADAHHRDAQLEQTRGRAPARRRA